MYCTKCGTLAPDGARFCRTCGQPLNAAENAPADVFAAPSPSSAPVENTTAPGMAVPPVPPPVSPPGMSVPPPAVPYYPPVIPPPVPLPAPFAGFWLRVVAHLIDSAIMGVVFGAFVAIAVGVGGIRFFRGFTPPVYPRPANPIFPLAAIGALLVFLPILIAVAWIYYAAMESSSHQATLGKMALGLFVTDLQGQPVSFGRASGRFFAKLVTQLIPFGIGYMMAGFTEKKQALHDMIAGCLVLKRV